MLKVQSLSAGMWPVVTKIAAAVAVLGGLLWVVQMSASAADTYTSMPKPTNTAGLQGLWRFDETAGTTAADSSSYGRSLAGTNIAGTEWTQGAFAGNGFGFTSAATQHFSNADATQFLAADVYVADFWIKPTVDWDVIADDQTIFAVGAKSGAASGTSGGWMVKVDADTTNKIQIVAQNGAGVSVSAFCANAQWDANTWYHFYVEVPRTGSPANIKCIINGEAQALTSASGGAPTGTLNIGQNPTNPFDIGTQSAGSGSRHLDAVIDDFGYYTASLLASGVQTCSDTSVLGAGTTGYCYEGAAISGSGTATIEWLDGVGVVSEDGAIDQYTVTLDSAPTANVTITPAHGAGQITLAPTTLTFTPDNWNVPQLVTVAAVDDAVDEGTHQATITHTSTSDDADFHAMTLASLTVSIVDNDETGVCSPENSKDTVTGLDCQYRGLRYTSENNYPMRIYMPDNYDSSRTDYPVIFGFSGRNSEFIFERPWNEDILELAKTDRDGWILVDFYGLTTRAWYDPGSIAKVDEIIRDVLTDFAPQIDENRIHTFGASMGVGGALTYTQLYADLVASTFVASGVSDYAKYVADNEVYAGEVSTRWNNNDTALMAEYDLINNIARVCGTPLYIVHGNTDATINVSQSRNLRDALDLAGNTLYTYTEYNIGHDLNYIINTQNLAQPILNFYAANELGNGQCLLGTTDQVEVLQTAGTTTVDDATTDTIELKLVREPTVDVTVSLATQGGVALSTSSLTFTPDNWDTPQVVTLSKTGQPSYAGTDTVSFAVTSSDNRFNGVSVVDVPVTIEATETVMPPETPTVSYEQVTLVNQTVVSKRPTFSGTASVGATVTVTVYSDPVSCTTTADANGNWSCTLPSDLTPGEHTVYVTVTPFGGGTPVELGPYTVIVEADEVTTVAPGAPNTGAKSIQFMGVAAIIGGVVGGLLGIAVLRVWRHNT